MNANMFSMVDGPAPGNSNAAFVLEVKPGQVLEAASVLETRATKECTRPFRSESYAIWRCMLSI